LLYIETRVPSGAVPVTEVEVADTATVFVVRDPLPAVGEGELHLNRSASAARQITGREEDILNIIKYFL